MIYLTPGITASIWMSLRESVTYGSTASFDFTFTNDITGATKSFTPTDLQPTNKWSRFEILVDTPESLPGTIDMLECFDTGGQFKAEQLKWEKFPEVTYPEYQLKAVNKPVKGLKWKLDVAREEYKIPDYWDKT